MRALAGVALLVLGTLGFQWWGQEESGNRAYRRGDYPSSVERYRSALAKSGGSPRLLYNLGTALSRLGESDGARETLLESLEDQSPELRSRAFYNLGNVLAQAPEGDRVEAEHIRAAIDAYRRSLLLDPERGDARWNLELAMRRLDELEQQQSLESGDENAGDPPESEGAEDRQRPEGGQDSRAPRTGETRFPEGSDLGDADSPLPRELAEQILRAVEENERSLQREKQRRQRGRVTGPDW
jgi:Ca-activated chloride channel family protein